jgi:phosphomevalonate kinase
MGELLGLFYLDPVEATREARLRLLEATHKAGFAYESPALEIIAQEALVLGGAARPSGAGGGDCALAYFHDGDTANRFSRRMAELGFPRIDVRLAGAASFEPSPETWASP